MRILVDADIILEYLLNRENFKIEAEILWNMIESRKFEAFITEQGLDKICFYISQLANPDDAQKIINNLQKSLKICPVNKYIIQEARTSHLRDFETAIEVICANTMNLDAIVAWNPQDFNIESSFIKVLSVSQLFILYWEKNFSEESKFISEKGINNLKLYCEENIKRLKVVNIITNNKKHIIANSIRDMIRANETLIQPGGNCYTHPRMAACLRDSEIILRYVAYTILAGDASILEYRCLNGLKETYLVLGVPINSVIDCVTIMKGKIVDLINNHTNESQLEMVPTNGDYSAMTREVNNYFDLITTSLS